MKSILVSLVVFLFASSLCSFEKGGLLYKPMPVLPNKTLDGKTIDADYFKGHVTVVTFMFIGCPPCMNEISVLNKLKKKYAGNEEVQILCIARQMRGQMEQFNFIDTSMFGKIRLALKVPRMEYAIQPACADAQSKMEQSGDHIQIKPECDEIENTYGVSGFPTTFYVDRRGIIREIYRGGPGKQNDKDFLQELRKNVDRLLAEK